MINSRDSSGCIALVEQMRGRPSLLVQAAVAALCTSGCALQGPYIAPDLVADGTRLAVISGLPAPDDKDEAAWWTRLADPCLDALVPKALTANPSLSRAVAALDLARAEAGASQAGRRPSALLTGSASVADSNPASPVEGGRRDTGALGLSLAWEVDLFGRLRSGAAANALRLESRTAEAQAVQLALVSEVADTLASLRACRFSAATLSDEIASRQTDVDLTIQRRDAGMDADLDVAQAVAGLATAQTLAAERTRECAALTHTLSLLTGETPEAVIGLILASPGQPAPPPSPDAVPSTLLVTNPAVAAAERAVAAAWSDIETARADRMPRLDLASALSGQWIDALGSQSEASTGAISMALSEPLFDGGRGATAVAAAQARHAIAIADLDLTLRTAARDLRNAIAAGASAQRRSVTAANAVAAAAMALQAREAQWQAGAVSQFELQDARRQLAAAQESEISASRDKAQAWIALVRTVGPQILPKQDQK